MDVFYLSTCDTCKKIMKDVGVNNNFSTQDIKAKSITKEQVKKMLDKVEHPSELINKRARKYAALNLSDGDLTKDKVIELITNEYTFLKRPVFIDNKTIFAGNSKKTIESLKQYLIEK